ncbi:MerR family transcriptional regulator [Nocardia sp. GCM10030253]|uniref:MerR family transcriptional regulator n=1 Tax=Nocardia sp. GCM10030253 TaxID=3273404 RepID=UPI00362E0BE7
MLIGELSRRTGVGSHLLRYYESQGLLEPDRGTNGYREYTDDAILTVTQIRGLLEAGLSTEDIAYLLPCATGAAPELAPCSELVDVLRARLHGLDERIDALTQSRQALDSYLNATERALATSSARNPPR